MLLYGNKESREQVRIQLVMTSLAHIMILCGGGSGGNRSGVIYSMLHAITHLCTYGMWVSIGSIYLYPIASRLH